VLTQPVARANGGSGIRARVSHGRIERARTDANAADGLRAAGTALTVTDSVANANGGGGIAVQGAHVVDAGGNRAQGNRGLRHARAVPQAECAVGTSCR